MIKEFYMTYYEVNIVSLAKVVRQAFWRTNVVSLRSVLQSEQKPQKIASDTEQNTEQNYCMRKKWLNESFRRVG